MALSFFTESAAPRDFRISSTESDSHYTKCPLCYTIKKNFYCADCIKAGNFVNSSMPYADRFAEKQLKLHRLKANRKYVQERCEAILLIKSKKDSLQTATKQCCDRINLIRLAIEQRQNSIAQKRQELDALTQYNHELGSKLPKYRKRVSNLSQLADQQRRGLQNKAAEYDEKAQSLAALRRARIRQLINYIFPVYISYGTSDSVDEMEFLRVEPVTEPVRRMQLHVVAPWLPADGDFSYLHNYRETETECPAASGAHAALGFLSQAVALLAWCLDVRLRHGPALADPARAGSPAALTARTRRLRAALRVCCARGGLRPPSATHALLALDTLAQAANRDSPALGRMEGWSGWSEADVEEMGDDAPSDSDEDEPEHLHWGDFDQLEHSPRTPAQSPPAASLVTSAAASIASIWRGWTK